MVAICCAMATTPLREAPMRAAIDRRHYRRKGTLYIDRVDEFKFDENDQCRVVEDKATSRRFFIEEVSMGRLPALK